MSSTIETSSSSGDSQTGSDSSTDRDVGSPKITRLSFLDDESEKGVEIDSRDLFGEDDAEPGPAPSDRKLNSDASDDISVADSDSASNGKTDGSVDSFYSWVFSR